ncbi:hypothetical protein IAR55_000864 [Kwoniella newhampshirensis]|uniref:Sld7 C-terminal domain-containing protein n=1 Tax=Kwoniella newhampshirensis TaxID=1651941 RepID=A0AAW0Z492_9TREE
MSSTLELRTIGPSPSRNPFARPKLSQTTNSSGSFTRKSLLPTSSKSQLSSTPTAISTNAAPVAQYNEVESGLSTPASSEKKQVVGSGLTASAGKTKNGWRLLWRGGLEIGRDGWRLDGITFFAQLSFPPSTPSASTATPNPFDAPYQPSMTSNSTSTSTPSSSKAPAVVSPFPLLPSGDTDLCLSLESMRGRKYLQVRGLVDLTPDEILEGTEGGDELNGGVQMSIAPGAALLVAYFTGLLCRNEKLSNTGRTLSAIVIGLGDEDVDTNPNSSILVYGQRQEIDSSSVGGQPTLRLCVGRRKPPPPPTATKVRPGEPLPRAPLFFPAKAPKKPPPPFPNRSLSRTSSISSSIYHPPQPPPFPAPVPVRAPVAGRTPGRRGEKRPRHFDPDAEARQDELRKRKSGRIVFERATSASSRGTGAEEPGPSNTPVVEGDEDIFGRRATASVGLTTSVSMSRAASGDRAVDHSPSGAPLAAEGTDGAEGGNDAPNTGKAKRVRVPQQVLDNKAAIRKQTLVLLEGRGISRTHDMFKDVFAMTTKGAYFAFRDHLQDAPLSKLDVHRIVNGHLDMYLPYPMVTSFATEDREDESDELVKVEMKEEYAEFKVEGTFLHIHDGEGRVKLEAVEEEDEMDIKEV